jgi:hypothetical protein
VKSTRTRERTHSSRLRVAAATVIALAAMLSSATLAIAAPTLSWSPPASTGSSLSGVSCPSFGLCVAVGGTTVHVSTDWSSGYSTSAPHALLAISCAPGTSSCVAVGDGGAIVRSTSPGSSSWSTVTSGDANDLTSVSCASTTFCLAVDADGGGIYSTSDGASWALVSGIDGSDHLAGVSCPTSAFCAAVDESGHILVSTTPTSGGWKVVASDGVADLTGISCATSGTCVAVDSGGDVWASADASSAPSTWSETSVASGFGAVSCTAEALCIASDGGSVYASDDPTASGPSWVSAAPDGATITAVSCTDQGLCAAVDGAGNALTATLPAPGVTTGAATATSPTTATLSASVNPGDATLTSCYFSYGTTTAYGATVPCASTPSPTGGAQTVTAQIGGLSASTTYDFRVVATSDDGTAAGANASFVTPAPLRPSPSISGTPAVGDTLTCNLGVTVPAGLTVTYKWVGNTTTIAGATAATYVVALTDETHHLYCNATISGDGGSAGASSGYVAVPAETLGTISETSVGKPSFAGHAVSTTITCSPQAASACTVALHLTTGTKHKTTIGSTSTRIAAGAKVKVTLSLNAAGRRMLAAHHKLKTTLTVTGTIVGVISGTIKTQTVTFTTLRHAIHRDG